MVVESKMIFPATYIPCWVFKKLLEFFQVDPPCVEMPKRSNTFLGVSPFRVVHMKNDFRGLIVGWVEPIYVKLKEVEKLTVRHFKWTKKNLKKEFARRNKRI